MPRHPKIRFGKPEESTHLRLNVTVYSRLLNAGAKLGLGRVDEKTKRWVGAPVGDIVETLLRAQGC